MRNLIMWNLITLDGMFEGPKAWDLPWHQRFFGEELERFSIEQLRTADLLVFGRATYEGLAAYWRSAEGEVARYMNSLPKVVFSRSVRSTDWSNTTVLHEPPAAAIARLRTQGKGNMFVFGSAKLCETLVAENLFDEYRVAIFPVIHGTGRPLFGRASVAVDLALLESRRFSNGIVLLRYARGDAMMAP